MPKRTIRAEAIQRGDRLRIFSEFYLVESVTPSEAEMMIRIGDVFLWLGQEEMVDVKRKRRV